MAYLADGEIGRQRQRPLDILHSDVTGETRQERAACLQAITMRYPGMDRPALTVDQLTLYRGERVAVIGPSGGGKTTLLRVLNGALQPTAGSIEILGEKLDPQARRSRELRRRTGMVFQNFALVERASVMQNVLAGRLGFAHPWLSLFGKFSDEDRRLAMEAITEVGLLAKANQRVDSLSGGQRQRVAIARVLAQAPEIILADEPVSNLDPALTQDVIDLLTSACERRRATLVMAIHQPAIAKASLDRIIAVKDGEIVFDDRSRALTEPVRSRIYERDSKRAASYRHNH